MEMGENNIPWGYIVFFCFLTEEAMFSWKKKNRDIFSVRVLRIVQNVETCDFASSLRKLWFRENFFFRNISVRVLKIV